VAGAQPGAERLLSVRGAKPGRALDAEVRRAAPIAPGAIVLAALSGGPDSVVLAAVLDRIARADGFTLVLAHVNHGTRASAWQDECVALSVGARLERSVLLAAAEVDGTDEASLRVARYAALEDLARAAGASAIATAHTAEDQTETVLLALFRGSGLDGLAGMAPVRALPSGCALLRPLLRVPRASLRAELRRLGLPYALDPTNEELRYRRNALRAQLDALRHDFPHLDAAVARCAEIVRAERADTPRARARHDLRERLRRRGLLDDIPFERIEAALDAGPEARVFLKPGVESIGGDVRARGD
jgi:tRNA(Ile)-lysidine synthase